MARRVITDLQKRLFEEAMITHLGSGS